MNISSNWLKKYIDNNLNSSQLDETLTMLGVEVESYIELSHKYLDFFIGEVLTKEKHPNADKLSVCQISLSSKNIQIVCGAPNVNIGQKVVIGIVGAIVPMNQIKLEKRKIRDVISEGMICSQEELGLGEDNSGIWVLPSDAPVGDTLIEYLELNDIILELSLTPNKADCASHLGIARELSAALDKKIIMPKISLKEKKEFTSDVISVKIEDEKLCPRYVARVIKNVKNSESPAWLKQTLINIGLRPINIVVDVTNYVLMDLGQPLHAFDLDKIKGSIIVKNGTVNDNFITIDKKNRKITDDMLMICDEEKPIAIAGVIGGKNSEITSDTSSVVLEAASFNASSIRKTSKKLMLQTDASYRFERGTDIDILNYAIDMAAAMIAELTGGDVLKGYVEVYNNPITPKEINFRFANARKIIGADITNSEMAKIFISLGFSISTKKVAKIKEIIVTIPNRRVDIFGEIDLIEEIARVYNYNSIIPAFASAIDFQRDEIPTTHKPLPIRNSIRTFLAHNGFTEILTPNMTDVVSALLASDKLIKIENPLGEEMSIMRTSMVPSILKILSFNIRQGSPNLKLFETGKIFLNQNDIFNSFIDCIDEREQLVVAITGNFTPRQWGVPDKKFDFFDLKGAIIELLEYLKIPKYKINPIATSSNIFSENSAEIFVSKTKIGIIGGILKNILDKYEIEFPVFVATMDLTAISSIEIPSSKYRPVSPFPVVKRDLAFLVDDAVASKEIKKTITEKGTHLLKSVNVFDVYKGKNIEQSKKSIGFELTFSSIDRTLVDEEIDSTISCIVSAVEKNFAAKLRTE